MTVAGPELAPIRERKMFFGEAFIRRLIERRAGDLYPREVDTVMEQLLTDATHEPSTLRQGLADNYALLLKLAKEGAFEGERTPSWVRICGKVKSLSKRGRDITSWKNIHVDFGETGNKLVSINWSLNYRQNLPVIHPALRDKQAKRVVIEYGEDGQPDEASFRVNMDPFKEEPLIDFSITLRHIRKVSA